MLDEPSIGLHQRDNHRLLETLIRLRDLGNTLIVVEHDEDTIRAADWVVESAPARVSTAGRVVVSGTVERPAGQPRVRDRGVPDRAAAIPVPAVRRKRSKSREVVVKGAGEHNLKDVDVAFPLGCFIAVTGVSGSGKSTLVNDILYRALARELHGARAVPGRHVRVTGMQQLDKVVHVDQGPIGRTPRSNPATYTGVFDHVRKLFAATAEAKVRGYLPGRFSFNVKGGRCEACAGDGTIRIEMQFLPDVYVPCEVCHGARYNTDTLAVHYKGRTIADVLDMPIEEAASSSPPSRRSTGTSKPWLTSGWGMSGSASPPPPCRAGRPNGSSSPPNCSAARPGGPSTCWTSRPPGCTSRTSANSSACWAASSTAATPSSSSSTTSTSSRPPTTSSTWAPTADPAAAMIATGTPEQIAQAEGSPTGAYLGRLLPAPAPAAA